MIHTKKRTLIRMMTDAIMLSGADLIDGLRRFQEDFNKDFSLRDVLHALRGELTKKELMAIKEIKSHVEQMDRLIFFYIYIVKDAWPLVNSLQDSYRWIYEKILSSSNDKWISDYRRAILDIPNNKDFNVHRTEYLWTIQQELKSLKRGHYLILFGKLGFGKKWLAADACRDYGVVYKMDFKIYWLNVSKCTTYELILDKLHRLKVLLQAEDYDIKYNAYSGNSKNESIHVKTHLRKVLERPEYKNCLIILTDVQDDLVVRAFDLNCKMLLTTRHMVKLESAITTEKRQIIEINKGLTECESSEIFVKAFRKEENANELPPMMTSFIENAHKICSGHPMVMSLVAKSFQNKESDYKRQTRCMNWKKQLEKYEFKDDYLKIKMPIEESLKFLTDKELKCYRQMVIFSDNIDVPFDVLSKLWNLSSNETENMIEKLHKYSLIQKQMSYDACSLHYVHYKYLKEEVSETDQITYHQQLIDEYDVERIFGDRTELELNFPDDNYFHFFIGYHLHGAKHPDLFDIYFDFGFLEEKIRIAKLPNTLGDLIKFKDEIVRKDPKRAQFLQVLLEFLPPVEQLVFKSKDMTILQCALNNEGVIKEEAQKQISRYVDRVWMDDVNHVENSNQMFVLQADSKPRIVRFAKLDRSEDNVVCLISLQDNNILLHDIATSYTEGPILYKNELPHSTITDMQIFRNQAFLVLNDTGKLSVYYLKWNSTRRPSAPSRLSTNEAMHERLPFVMDCQNDKFTCFNVVEQHEASNVDLIVGTMKGVIKFYKWIPKSNKFEIIQKEIRTEFVDLFRMAHINHYVMLLNSNGEVKFFNLINTGALGTNIKWQKQESPVSLHQGICSHTKLPFALCVSVEKVVQIMHQQNQPNASLVFLEYEEIFAIDSSDNRILSSAMSKDSEYLILGTSRGIMVIDRHEKKVVSRRNVSDQVLSLDVYRYPDEVIYILISVFKDAGQLISLHGFNGNREELSGHKTCFLVGENLFDVKKVGDEWSLVAVETKGSIHFRSCADNFLEPDRIIKFPFQIKRICYGLNDTTIVGCTNGSVYKIDDMEKFDLKAHLTGEITYMEKFDDIIIVSCNSCYQLLGMGDKMIWGKATKAFAYKEDTLLVVKKDCHIEFLDTKEIRLYGERELVIDSTCVAQAYHDSLLAIATSNKNVYLWKLDEENGDMSGELTSIENQIDGRITSIAISADNNVLAVGCFRGNIMLFDLHELIPIYTLESHKAPITNLQFSPWLENEGPIILVSLAGSINFWNVTHIQNNKLGGLKSNSNDTSRLRVSQRFKTPMKIIPTTFEISMQGLSLNEKNWSKKTGPANKRELLSCIKFLGKSAKKVVINEDFTRFVTIDNEGNIYHLRLINQSDEYQLTIDFNGNSSNLD